MKLIGALLAVGLVLAVPSSAGGSQLGFGGWCVHTEDGFVGLRGSVGSYEYDYYKPLRWVYRARPVDATRWFEAGGYVQTMDVLPEVIGRASGAGNFSIDFKATRVNVEGMVVRLDLIVGESEERYNRVAYYNDATMDPEDCKKPVWAR